MKRQYLIILLVALVLTSIFLLYNRSERRLPMTSASRMASPMSADISSYAAPSNAAAPQAASVVAAAPAAAPAQAAMAGQPAAPSIQRRVIGKASIELVVADTEAVVKQINQLMDELGGYVANANLQRNSYNGSERLQGTLQLRVPADQLDATLVKLEAMSVKARAKTINREDVTDQYTDIDAQLRNLTTTENELRQLLADVGKKPNATSEDILAVHRNLTDIRSQIDQLQGRKNMFDNLITLSTIDVTLTPDIVSQPVIEEGWQPVAVVRASLRDLVGTLQTLTDAGIWLVLYFLPVLLILCIPLVTLWLIGRAIVRRWVRRPLSTSVQSGPQAG
jgi:conjugal transfer/entry exclusion protein